MDSNFLDDFLWDGATDKLPSVELGNLGTVRASPPAGDGSSVVALAGSYGSPASRHSAVPLGVAPIPILPKSMILIASAPGDRPTDPVARGEEPYVSTQAGEDYRVTPEEEEAFSRNASTLGPCSRVWVVPKVRLSRVSKNCIITCLYLMLIILAGVAAPACRKRAKDGRPSLQMSEPRSESPDRKIKYSSKQHCVVEGRSRMKRRASKLQ